MIKKWKRDKWKYINIEMKNVAIQKNNNITDLEETHARNDS